MEKGRYIYIGGRISFSAKGKNFRMISLIVENETDKRIHITKKEIRKLKLLTEKINYDKLVQNGRK